MKNFFAPALRAARATGLSLSLAAGMAFGLAALAPQQAAWADTQPDAVMLRWPAISQEHIAFSFANKLWLAPRAGGVATPLASPAGSISFPRFSPDGKSIAFVGNYDGNRDIYTVAVAGGGIPERVTHHPGNESLSQWTDDGRLLFMSGGISGAALTRQTQLYTVAATGGQPTKLPMPYAGFGAISHDGKRIVFAPHSTDTRTWKRYRGGMATDLWLMTLADGSAKKITDWEGSDTLPMWGFGPASETIYYLTDAGSEHRVNIWSYDTASGTRVQITNFTDDDVRWPSIGPGAAGKPGKGEIIFQLGSRLMVLNLDSGKSEAVKVTIPGARPTLRAKMEVVNDNITDGAISPTGKRVLVEARGDIWSVPSKDGVVRNLTASSGVFERDPSWSPDGKWIAYFSDESGEYELWLRASDARNPEDEKKDEEKSDEKKGEEKKADAKPDDAKPDADKSEPKSDDKKADEKKDEAKKDEAKKDEPKAEKTKLKAFKVTDLGAGFRYNPQWSPDSKAIAFTDKAGALMLVSIKVDDAGVPTAEVKQVDKDPHGGQPSISWSHDSAWLAYDRGDESNGNECLWVYNLKSGARTRLTSPFFASSLPAFDRKGDYLYYRSARYFNNPVYADNDSTFAYTNTHLIMAAPLRADMKSPFEPKDDAEELKPEKKKSDAKPAAKPADKDEKSQTAKKDESKKDEAKGEVELSTWTATASGGDLQQEVPFQLTIRVKKDGAMTATAASALGAVTFSGSLDKAKNAFTMSGSIGQASITLTGTFDGAAASGSWTSGAKVTGTWKATRESVSMVADDAKPAEKKDEPKKDESKKADDKKDEKKEEKKDDKKEIKIDFDDFERRAFSLPIQPGNFGGLHCSSDSKLFYVRSGGRGSGEGPGIKVFDLADEAKDEKSVIAAGGFQMSGDGKKLLIRRGPSFSIHDAAVGGGKAQTANIGTLRTTIDPRSEWKQILVDAWRLHRDFFYEPTMHGLDWPKVREHYLKLLEDCNSREDVNFLISEMISELNIGHAYLQGPGAVEGAPAVGVGLLGADYTLETTPEGTAYRFAAIHEGGAHDADARAPLSRTGPKSKRVEVGDYILAVNGNPIDTKQDIYAAFIGLVDRPTLITVSKKPVIDASAREVLVRPIGSEASLRYRAWVENCRKHVEEKSGGQIGYIYVPNTGVDGQDELFRQFFGQRDKAALIIDDRWNGGGQIPTRFIELLNRPVTNYWARRDGIDWTWPRDSHQGPKAMLANGLAGSGGDMFPWLFKHNKLGKVIGTRTWGGLVGISGNPQLIDGGSITVPTFGFYKKDGTWGVEGHGVDPDIVVIDDPSKMLRGEDPQLDAAIDHLLNEIKTNPYIPAKRPPSPDRRGMGIPEKDR